MADPTPLPSDPIAEAHRHWQEHGWADAADGMAAVTAIMRTQQILLARIEGSLKQFGLTFARFELLRLLSFTRSGALPMAKAGARLQVHPTSVTNAVDRLESAGLVRRLAPDCSRIDIDALVHHKDLATLLNNMGQETANIHLGTAKARKRIAGALGDLPADWLETAAQLMFKLSLKDWNRFQA